MARIEGAPAGTKGISLFLVPKYRVNPDGSLGEFNDVVCTGIEEKMGIHGNSTCSLTLGGKGNCIGTLLGQENKGMRAMFLMMNEARALVGQQGFGCASASYMYALDYARQRIQGKNLLQMMDKEAPSVAIINHPDVRRMLMTMKAYVEGMRSLLYYHGYCHDRSVIADSEEEKSKFEGLVELLTPIVKGYVTDRSFDVTSLGVQVYGGYGFIKEYPMEQLMRDCRITMIYEGTNGIQAMDLLGRKLGMNKGKPMMDLMAEIQKVIAEAKEIDALKDIAVTVEDAVNKIGKVAMHMGATAMSENVLHAFAFACPFMEACGDVVLSWMLLWRANAASKKLQKKSKLTAYYEGQIKNIDFFANSILPISLGKMDAIMNTNHSIMDIADESFGG
ncbi:MAG: Acd17 [Candidatus Magnetoglobus multicellularis str. Araruama]|uniref:Acd17 n=1 Tax=Candidatus Magnetoglobus multicellularis str. Araruama TaxID=890399 RepID=A0A1V1P2T3_9BACT|nr:MAG: Acd17 [Candidatus Magnetoglobus multicellularis str. Araruama]